MNTLTHIAELFSSLKNNNITDEDYAFMHELFEAFESQTLGDLQNLYMTTDVVFLADVFESFREN